MEEAAQVREAATSAPLSVASRHLGGAQPEIDCAMRLSEGFDDDVRAVKS